MSTVAALSCSEVPASEEGSAHKPSQAKPPPHIHKLVPITRVRVAAISPGLWNQPAMLGPPR